jgi:hypothetical protein
LEVCNGGGVVGPDHVQHCADRMRAVLAEAKKIILG